MKTPQLKGWEVSLIRAMLNTGRYSKQQIVAYFSRPERSINQGRISEIEQGHERYEGIPVASFEELEQFLAEWNQLSFPSAPQVPRGPTHPDTLAGEFRTRPGNTNKLSISETSKIEGKESFNWGSKQDYCKTLAGMANNSGGYILFGVQDGSFEINGIAPDRMEKFDLRKANEFLTRSFNQSLELEKGSFEIEGKTVGVLYVHETKNKPVICKVDGSGLFSGDIYYRYPGETRRIQAPELEFLLQSRDHAAEQSLLAMVQKITRTGVGNSAIIDLSTGLVEGQKGSFFVNEALLEKVKVISQGHFEEKDGAPALTLIGELRTADDNDEIPIEQSVIAAITERNLQESFIFQTTPAYPKGYIQAQPCLQPKWLPIYYFASLEGYNEAQVIETLEQSETTYPRRIVAHTDRVRSRKGPGVLPGALGSESYINAIKTGKQIEVKDEEDARKCLDAMRHLSPSNVSLERILIVLRQLFERFGNSTGLKNKFRYVIADIDLRWFSPKVPRDNT
ncbi:ATP-binding protein [Aestuariispira ectoiniformans]|uniref:ATP-binding protein n=1 Tax=Aestuariispira ectoiniformans TaxID=2775080 RepID=UPI00223C26BA|nr:ATP-binding protein [Aestuariispira ectoiniformans]